MANAADHDFGNQSPPDWVSLGSDVELSRRVGCTLRQHSTLCALCRNMVHSFYTNGTRSFPPQQENFRDLKSLRASAKGCDMCIQSLEYIHRTKSNPKVHGYSEEDENQEWRAAFQDTQPKADIFGSRTGDAQQLREYFGVVKFPIRITKDDLENDSIQFTDPIWERIKEWCIKEKKEIDLEIVLELIPTETRALDYDTSRPSTRDALRLCKVWLQECRDKHSCYSPSTRRPPSRRSCASCIASLCSCLGRKQDHHYRGFLPTRLITTSGEPKLILSEGLRTDEGEVRYATLSHCWGSLPFMTLRMGSLEQFKQCIPSEALMTTFQHAIEVCRYLDIPYLWIDSLCIIQDSGDDWKKEAYLMTDVYGSSELTISAESAYNGSVGCFFEREKTWRCQIVPDPRKPNRLYNCVPDTHFEVQHPLSQRAWVLQEGELSPRSLHFARDQVFWECKENRANETFPTGYQINRGHYVIMSGVEEYAAAYGRIKKIRWPYYVEEYTRRLLTESSDKMVAIAGIARVIFEKEAGYDWKDDQNSEQIRWREGDRDRYIAGMWLSRIPYDLFWGRKVRAAGREVSTEFKYPTWSWISADGPIFWMVMPSQSSSDFVRVHEAAVTYADRKNTLGPVKKATLRIDCGALRPVTIEERHIFAKDEFPGCMIIRLEDMWVNFVLDTLDYKDSVPAQVYFLPLYSYARTPGVVLRAMDNAKGVYERVGSFQKLASGEREEPRQNQIWPESRSLDANLFSEVVTDENGNQKFILDLV
ncbi:heterokaryon incompatibility protein-domain-containing protein [Hypoxylon trugodes]|uniref:heterokaryon incompatibility protein-domain-containing protein n=1 Tax=Hypoxylon trugodes TaxID=326681 RepID=UPI00219C34DB|nr:heterokaryon incompatibility protein-domain-containing protein [Hypoxylon trugodes]KAI1387317.1 heterokaryon incompatibility protein-domain-containing protein [Hypoxylon trugodes]